MKPNQTMHRPIIIAFLVIMTFVSGSATAGKFVPYKSKGVAGLIDFPDLLPISCDRSAVEGALDGNLFTALDGGTATHLGKYSSTIELSATPIFFEVFPGFECLVALQFQGVTRIQASNRDVLESFLVVTLDLLSKEINGSYTVLGGSGRWVGATGEGIVIGNLNEDGSFSYRSVGDISRPKSRK